MTPPADNHYERRLIDPELAETWRAYHHKLAVIRVVAKDANLRRSHEGKVKRKDQLLQMTANDEDEGWL
jgi:hypothetical protein